MSARPFSPLVLLQLGLVACAACQTMSGVDDLEVVSDRDGAAATAGARSDGSTGSGGSSGSGGGAGAGASLGSGGEGGSGGSAGSFGSGGISDGSADTGGDAGVGGNAGVLGSAGVGGSAGVTGSAGATGSAGTNGAAGTGGSAGTGGAPQCADANGCPAESDPCMRRTCTSGRCGLAPEPQGTMVTEQTAGDCRKNVCDGGGRVVSVNDDTDPKDDGKVCTRNVCTSGVPSNPPEPVNTPCGINTKCDGAGRCVGCTSNGDCPADTPCTDWACVTATGTCSSTPRSMSTPCGPAPACTSGVEYPQDYCDGAGACRDSGSRSCSPLVCGTGACLGACTTDATCITGYYCATTSDPESGGCQPKKGLGTSCAGNSQCTSGYCVDGVCCENACTGLCNTCNGVDSGGLPPGYCFPIASERDPANECAGGRVCNGSSGCTGVQNCDCSTPRYSAAESCCTSCSNAECPSQASSCSMAHATPCKSIGAITTFRTGLGVPDQSASCGSMAGQPGMRCAIFACTCIQ